MVGFTCFSTQEDDDDDDDDDNHNNDGDDDTEDEEDEEVNFPNQGYVQQKRQTVQGRKQPRTPIAAKNLNLIRAPKCGKSSYAEIAAWNRSARQGAWNETKRGWMAKTEQQRDARRRLLRKTCPGIGALRNIRFYQKSTCFLIPMQPFQRFIRQVALDFMIQGREVHWQAKALFLLQQAAESYLVTYLEDSNLLAIHAGQKMIMEKDMKMVHRIQECRAIAPELSNQ